MLAIAALIPIKDHSERVPAKNFRPFCGRPLYHWILETLEQIDHVQAVYIDTDSARIEAEAPACFPKVRIIRRPQALCGDFTSTNEIFAYDLTQIPAFDVFLQTHATNPLLRAQTICRAITLYEEQVNRGACDSLFSVTRYQCRFYRADGSPVNHDPKELLRTQDLPPLFEENSNLYLFSRRSFAAHNRRIGERPCMFEMDRLEAVDIDDAASFTLAQLLATALDPDRFGQRQSP